MKKIVLFITLFAILCACTQEKPIEPVSMKQNLPLSKRSFPEYVHYAPSEHLYVHYTGEKYSLENFQKAYDLIASGEIDAIDLNSEDGKAFKIGHKLKPTTNVVIVFPRTREEQTEVYRIEGAMTFYYPTYYMPVGLNNITDEIKEKAVNYQEVFDVNPYYYTRTYESTNGETITETRNLPVMYMMAKPYSDLSEFSKFECKLDYPSFAPNHYDSSKDSKEFALSSKALAVLKSVAFSLDN